MVAGRYQENVVQSHHHNLLKSLFEKKNVFERNYSGPPMYAYVRYMGIHQDKK